MAKSKKKEQRKKKLRSLILLLFLTIVMLSTATYAWFTANRSVAIDPIDVHVATSSGLTISVEASDWKTLITNNDIILPGGWTTHTNMLPFELEPVSTDGTVSNGLLQFYKGTVEGDRNQGGALALTAEGPMSEAQYVYTLNGTNRVYPTAQGTVVAKYIAFDIFLKNDDTSAVKVYLTEGSGVTITADTAGSNGLQNAARYAFVKEGQGLATTDVATMRSWSTGTSSIIVEPNYDMHTSNAVAVARDQYNQTTVASTADTAPLPYKGVKAEITSPIILRNTNPGGSPSATYFSDVADLRQTNTAYSTSTAANYSGIKSISSGTTVTGTRHELFTLQPGVTKYRVYMWVEGQDVDCENSASNAFLTYNIGLSLDSTPQ